LRFTRCPQTCQVVFDIHQRLPGRGAYLCPNAECLRRAIKRKSLERALKTKVDASVLDTALEYLRQDT
jgi:predicted RNA-binding protein YlxR (DUF448 family)